MRLSKEKQNQLYPPIIEEFLSDPEITLADLAQKYQLSYASLYKFAQKQGVTKRKATKKPRRDEKLVQTVVQEYQEDPTATLKSLAAKYGICYPTVARWLKRAGIQQRSALNAEYEEKLREAAKVYVETDANIVGSAKAIGVGKNNLRKYLKEKNMLKKTIEIQKDIVFNKKYFQRIDTEEKAYWFGFIYADGCVRYNEECHSGYLSIEISEEDIETLREFNKCLDSNVKIKRREKVQKSGYVSKMCSVTMNSVKMVKDLMKHGCVPNKTYDGKIPKKMFADNNKLMASFLRGYLDGDGYISRYIKSVSSMSYVVHNHNVANFLLRGIIQISGVIPQIRYEYAVKNGKVNGAYRLRIMNREDFVKFLNVLYDDAHICMDRKYERYLEHITSRPESSSQKTLDDESGIKLEGPQA